MFMLEIEWLCKSKLYAGIKMHVDVHDWNCMILLDSINKLYTGIEMHVNVHAWNCIIEQIVC
jgi:hypothetical protein